MTAKRHSTSPPRAACAEKSLALPVLATKTPTIRPSRMGKRRAAVLIAVHLLIILHVLHWLIAGKTISPVEPSEAMYTLNHGHLNAGFLFFAAAIAATALLGRFVCGWGCHFIAYQDLAAWIMKKIGVKPKPFRARLLVLAPLALALYMFVWPSVYRLIAGVPFPSWSNHLITRDFWATFPGPVVAVLTVLLAGMAIVYFLGAKGFCTYACPYGGFFGVADRFAPGRIRVTDACEHCGHCTAVCTSNVRVHEEVALFGMVVDPGCMKCMDCVSVCPNDALYFGFTPAVTRAPAPARRPVPYDFTRREELLMLVVGFAALLALRGLYDLVPLLMAMGLAAITGYLAVLLVRLFRDANVRLQNHQWKKGGRCTPLGRAAAVLILFWMLFVAHGGFVQAALRYGASLAARLKLPDDIWQSGAVWWDTADAAPRALHASATRWLLRADRYACSSTTEALTHLAWLAIAAGNTEDALRYVQRALARVPDRPEAWRALAAVHLKAENPARAEEAYRKSLALDPRFALARLEYAALLRNQGRFAEAVALYQQAIDAAPVDPHWPANLARLHLERGDLSSAETVLATALRHMPDDPALTVLFVAVRTQQGRPAEAAEQAQNLLAVHPDFAEAHYQLGMALLAQRRSGDAVSSLRRAAALAPQSALYHYNLAVAIFMAGRPDEALPIIEEALRLNPHDPDARGFLEVVRRHAAPRNPP